MNPADVEDLYELSPLQQGILFHTRAALEPGEYLITMGYALKGRLDVEALERAWQRTVDHNPILRTSFHWEDVKRPLQVVHRGVPLTCERLDWRSLGPEAQEARLVSLLQAERTRAFPLDRPPLMHVTVVHTSEERYRLVWTFHHLLLEGWSASLVLREVFARYRAALRGQEADVPPRPPYRDYILWVQQRDAARAEAYWRRTLAGFSSPTPLPVTRRPDPPPGEPIYGRRRFGLPAASAAALAAMARGSQLTLNTVFQGAWALLLARYGGTTDVVFGSVVSGRQASVPGAESMVGLFVNTLPARVAVRGEDAFVTWLKELQAQQLEMREYEYTSLLDVQGWSEVPRGVHLFESLFAFENWAGDVSLQGLADGLEVEDAQAIEGGTGYPLAVEVAAGSVVSGVVTYDRRRFADETVSRLAGHYETLLRGIAEDPSRRLSELPMLGPGERDQILVGWNDTARPRSEEPTLTAAFAAQARATPEAVALSFGDRSATYAEVDRRSNQLARHLRGLGVGPETRVGVCLDRSLELPVALLGIVKAGGAYVPLDPAYPAERLAFMLADSGAPVVVTDERLAPQVSGHGARVVRLDGDGPEVGKESAEAPEAGVGPESLAYVIYTSGSTGTPKGVAVPHRAIHSLVRDTDYVRVEASDRIAQASNASFDAATFEIWGALLNGACVVGISREVSLSPRDLVSALREERVSILFLTTALFNQVAQEDAAAFSTLRHVLFGGEAVSPPWVARVLEAGMPGRLLHVYGPTETTTFATWHRVEAVPADAETIPIGRAIANARAYVLDDQMGPVPVGVPGELLIGGDGVARGYLDRPELTAERFVPDPFASEPGGRLYRTGDLVRWTAEGSIEFLGRKDHQVKVRGFRIELGEIEAALRRHPAVKDVVAVVREDVPGDKRLVAYVVRAEELAPAPAADLRSFLKDRVPEYMVPSACVFLERLPLNPNGKVDRAALPPPEARPHPEQALVPPRNDLERTIAAVWMEVLHLEAVGVDDNFFDLGGHSLTLLRVHAKLRERLAGADVKIVDLFQYPTVGALAAHLSGAEPEDERMTATAVAAPSGESSGAEDGIAIIGMAGRFPGARDLEEFWRNLRDGVESLSSFSAEELEAEGYPAAMCRDPRFVPARGAVEGAELFDAPFFGYNPREAEMIDPQQRVFLETAWTALERAGYDGETHRGQIGVYAGTSLNTYLLGASGALERMALDGGLPALIASDKDFLTTRVSYKLNLKGPSVDVQTACSTSLVAVHLACQSLRAGECDIALAGGVSLGVPQKGGYLYQEGGILSPDGHCRAFDRRAQGTVGGSGVGVVVLKRLRDARADGDAIQAVIRGSAINNDGAVKVGYTAPGVEGQADVIAKAQASARVAPESIGYIEAHGTGTSLGDPIEVRALRRVFGGRDGRRRLCAIGSLKTNIGHLDAAAGVAGLIKTVLALQHRQIPPSLHFEEPNPAIDFADSPFFVNARLSEWTTEAAPRRAGVSSFGIGGTNAHVIVEEAPAPAPREARRRPFELLVLSARTTAALDEATPNLARHLDAHPDLDLADVAFTLQAGRRAFRHRRVAVCSDLADARRALQPESGRLADGASERAPRGVCFLFPGQGAQHPNMLRGLYGTEEAFRSEVDRCVELLSPDLGFDLREVLHPAEGGEEEAARRLDETAVAQPALFVVEYALARLWMEWGVKPEAMLGHSVGEYVAACLAGVFSLPDALSLVAARGRLMQEMARGSMLSVPLPEAEVALLLDGTLALAAVNAGAQCVVSGPTESVERLEERLRARAIEAQRLRTSHAFHSAMMEPALEAFRARVSAVERHAPKIPYVSNLTGTWATDAQAADAGEWARHLRGTVRFSAGLAELMKEGPRVFLEVGPGQTLGSLARQPLEGRPEPVVVASCRHPRDGRADEQVLLGALGRIWLAGVDVDWTAVHARERRRRVALPTYPFERKPYSIARRRAGSAPPPTLSAQAGKKADIADWFYRPTWRSTALDGPGDLGGESSRWLVFADDSGLGRRMAERLEEGGRRTAIVTAGDRFERTGKDAYAIRPGEAADYETLLRDLKAEAFLPDRIAHLWGVTRGDGPAPTLERTKDLGFYSLLFLARALGSENVPHDVALTVVTSGMQEVSGEGLACPEKAMVLGPCRVIPQEYESVTCRSVDVIVPASGTWADDEVDRLLSECGDGRGAPVVAHRRDERWVLGFEAHRLEPAASAAARLRDKGVYLVTGGLGGIGLEIAGFLAERAHARLVLIGRTRLPPRDQWAAWRDGRGDADATSRTIAKVEALEARGAEVLVLSADVADRARMEEAFAAAESRFGAVHGVIHAAGVAPGGVIQLKTREMADTVLAPKVTGTLVLQAILAERRPDFVVLCSSLASFLGVPGQVDYCAANAFQDAFARQRAAAGGPPVVSLAWDTWREAGMARDSASADAMLPAEGVEVFARTLGRPRPQLLVSTVELGPRVEQFRALGRREAESAPVAAARHPRPDMATPFVAPRSPAEQTIASLWQELLGFERIGIHDNFFELGGHSLLLVQAHRRLKELFPGRELSVVELFAHSTVAALAGHLSGAPEPPAAAAAEELQAEADRREAGRDRLGRRRGIHTALAAPEGADA